jgi:type IV pilus assembly protein PilC
VIHDAIKRSVISIAEGETITQPLKESKVFPPMVIQMISVGEKTGGLDEMLSKIADFYDEEVDAAVAALTSMIEPVIIVLMGAVIGGILIAMYLPMFEIIGKIS